MADLDTAAGFTQEGSYVPDSLFAGDTMPRVRKMVTILTGAAHVRGEVLGQIAASGKYILSVAAAGDGSQTPRAILAQAVDATGGDMVAEVFLTGEFNEAGLTFGAGWTANTVREALRNLGIFLRTIVVA